MELIRLPNGARRASKTITFTGAADLGAIGNVPILTVTGEVLVLYIEAFSTTAFGGAGATMALGVTGSTSLFIGASTMTGWALEKFWFGVGSFQANGIAVPAAMKDILITDNIVGTVAVANVTSGVGRFDVLWVPLSSDGLVA